MLRAVILAAIFYQVAQTPPPNSKPVYVRPEALYQQLERTANRLIASNDTRAAQASRANTLRKTIDRQTGTIHVKFTVPIIEVLWEHGTARIRTADELGKYLKQNKNPTIKLHRHADFYAVMSETDAAEIAPNATLTVSAKLRFTPKETPTMFIAPKEGPALYHVSTFIPHVEFLGYYTAHDLALSIRDRKLRTANGPANPVSALIAPPK